MDQHGQREEHFRGLFLIHLMVKQQKQLAYFF